ncbi:disease resistance protein RGA2-like isoform X2 [Salvia splendens]|uniref:disease resistance protein RGA2-like isoform X2 n=1 Tax=Salvia splendens TaxID=180675 RepID=UPI001C25567A|nr:disease resistance protein RGA2-like isoform X2 [Salvia splendens]
MEGVSSAAIEVLVQNLTNLLRDEYSLLRGLDEDAQQLLMTLRMIQAYLNDFEKKSITQDAVKIWLRELDAVAFNADNVLDELNYHLLHKKVKKMKTPQAKDKLNAEFECVKEMATDLGLQSMFVNAPAAVAHSSFETDSFILDPIFIGRDDDLPKVVDMFTQIHDDRIFSILALVGMGGMGKTTLTKKVFNHEGVKARFGSRIWIHVSPTFDPIILFSKILDKLTRRNSDGVESRDDILKKIQEALKTKTYLLVLDDVWNEDVPKWEDFINSMIGATSTEGNGIIITTRSERVAAIVNPFYIHHLDGLSDEDCWSIIKAKAFAEYGEVPLEFKMIGRKIAKRCQGLPLAANVVGSVLRRCESEQEWRSINENWISYGEGGESILRTLKLSFDHLSSPSLKKCFAYCSIFPKDRKMEKEELIELWMAEGFLQPSQSDDMESVGDMFFNVLLQNSLLQVAHKDNYGNVWYYVMHGLVHDLASFVLSNDADGSTIVRFMFHKEESSSISEQVAKHLRTLFFEGGTSGTISSGTIFSDFKYLRNLILSGDNCKELPTSVRKLIHLRNLDISNTSIGNLPKWIDELYQLQTLRACKSHLEKPKLPSMLRHLYIKWNTDLPAEIGRLTCLRTLPYFRVGIEKGYQIEVLGRLKHLRGKLEIDNLENLREKGEALKANMFQKSNLSELVLRWEAGKEGVRNDEAVLEGLQPHENANLQKLTISGFQGKRFPAWTQDMTGLIAITLSSCQECEEIPTLGHLPNLKSLRLRRLSNVRSINSSFHGTGNGEGVIFPALESILLLEMAVLNEWKIEFSNEVTAFPRLKSLKMYHCYNLECLPDLLFRDTLHLSELDIRHCSKLKELPDGLHALNYLEQMIIRGCRELTKMVEPFPSGWGSLSSLRSLEIRDCQELTKMVEPSAPSLTKVCVVDLKSVQNLPKFLDCLAESPLLEQLTVVSVPEVTLSTSTVKIWPFDSLKKLEMDVSMQWSKENNEAIKVRVDGILKNCHSSLCELSLTGLEMWDSLPDSMQHFIALYSLELENFGVKALPKWFGGLSNLERLCLSDFTNLRSLLPSMRSLTKLQELHIRDCPQLRIESERHKILNRSTNIYVNGHKR